MSRKRQSRKAPSSWRDQEPTGEELEHSPEEWLIPARDDLGHSSRMFFRLSPMMERAMEVFIQGKTFPYRTSSDLIRHALYRHLGFLHKLEPDFSQHYYASMEMIAQVVREDEMRTGMERVFDKLSRQIEGHLAVGDMGEAVRLAGLARSKLSVLDESAWKDRYLERFRRQFRHITAGNHHSAEIIELPPLMLAAPVDEEEDDD